MVSEMIRDDRLLINVQPRWQIRQGHCGIVKLQLRRQSARLQFSSTEFLRVIGKFEKELTPMHCDGVGGDYPQRLPSTNLSLQTSAYNNSLEEAVRVIVTSIGSESPD